MVEFGEVSSFLLYLAILRESVEVRPSSLGKRRRGKGTLLQVRFSDVTPVVLQAGVETVVGAFLDGDLASSCSTDPSWAGFGGVGSIDPRVTIIEDRYSGSATLSYAFPSLTDIQDLGGVPYAWVGANFREASVVPAPAAVWLFGSALAGLGAVRRRPGPVVRSI
jgi:hypothetical protein